MTATQETDLYLSAAAGTTMALPTAFPLLANVTSVGQRTNVTLVMGGVAREQAWFWTPAWQKGEREASEEIAAGRTTRFASAEDFLAALDREVS